MLRFVFLILLFVLSVNPCILGNQDSLLILLESKNEPVEKIKLYEELFKISNDQNSKLKYARLAYQTAKANGLTFLEAKSLFNLSSQVYLIDGPDESIELFHKGLSALESITKYSEREIFLKSKICHALGGLYTKSNDYSGAINSYNKALNFIDDIENDTLSLKPDIYINIGWIYEHLATYDLAETYYLKAKELYTLKSNIVGQLLAINNYASSLRKQNKHVEVITQSKIILNMLPTIDSLDFAKNGKISEEFVKSTAFYNLGISHLFLEVNSDAKEYLLKAKRMYEEMDHELFIAYCDLFISKIEYGEDRSTEVLETIQHSYDIAVKHKNAELRKLSSRVLSEVLESKDDYKGAMEASMIEAQIKDSIDNKELSLKLQSLQMQNDFEREKAILKEVNEKEILETKLRGKDNRNKMLWVFLCLLGTSCLLLFNAYKTTAQVKDELAINNVELAESENQLSIINQDLQKHINLNLELEQFAYVASHDIKAPLRTIYSFGTLLKNRFNNISDEKSKSYLDFMLKGAMSLNLLVDDLLEFSKSDTKTLQITAFELNDLVDDVTQNLDFSISQTNATIEKINLSVIVNADYVKLKQILQNLISNALKFYSPERTPRVIISLSDREELYAISVSDNGIGIPEDKFEEVFQKFHRLHSKDKFEGTGLGLSICKKYVQAHNGNISIRKNDTYGITVDFTISSDLT